LIFAVYLVPLSYSMVAIDRIGIGYDIHRLVTDRKSLLAAVAIDFEKGLLGHSDGDVVLHAVIDATLGAAGLPDIGEQFGDTDPKYKDADSAGLFEQALQKIRHEGYSIVNIDLIVHLEKPNLGPYKRAMREKLATLASVDVRNVNVKAKTAEMLGSVGGGEAIACTAVVGLTTDKPMRFVGNNQ